MMGAELDNSSAASHAMTQAYSRATAITAVGDTSQERGRRFLAGDYIALGLQSLRIIFTLILQ